MKALHDLWLALFITMMLAIFALPGLIMLSNALTTGDPFP